MEERLPRTIKRVWIYGALLSGAVGLIITGGLWVAHLWWHWWGWLTMVALVLTVLDVIIELGLVPYRYAFWRYQITPLAVRLQSGVIFRKEVTVPISRIQNVTLAAGPFLQSVRLQSVTVETAASSYQIDGVTRAVASQLRDQIMTLAQEAQDEA